MALMTIELKTNPETGKKDLVIHLKGEEDALPIEHETTHRKMVEKVLGKGLLKAEELGEVIVTRDEVEHMPEPSQRSEEAERKAVGQGH